MSTLFILDSGNLEEYRHINQILRVHSKELWGGTTNPSLIAKELQGRKVTTVEAFNLQKEIVMHLLKEVSGAVSAEVYADNTTSAQQMVEQGREIASWDRGIAVKLPTTIEGMKARTELRKAGITVNNTLVFTQQQIFAICMHEKLVLQERGERAPEVWPPFISPFIGRLDDQGQNGLQLIEHGMTIKEQVGADLWMLAASVRTSYHMQVTLRLNSELVTAPAKVYEAWYNLSEPEQQALTGPEGLQDIPQWEIPQELLQLTSTESLIEAMSTGKLDITHPLTDKGLAKFAEDWHTILA